MAADAHVLQLDEEMFLEHVHARKLKIMENEKHPLDDVKNYEITKKREK